MTETNEIPVHPKVWGAEHWIVNREYCGKKLLLKQGYRCSVHHHKIKDETFYVIKGRVLIDINGQRRVLVPGDKQHIAAGESHRFTGLEPSEMIEFSTHHREDDSYRDVPSGKVPDEEFRQLLALAHMTSNKQERHMGTFHVGARIENHADRRKASRIPKLLVDTGSEHTWLPETVLEKIGIKREKKDVSFIMANGTVVTRSVGFAIIRVDKYFTIDEVVFAEKGDLMLLGARTLEGLNLTVSPNKRRLLAAGPIPAA